MRPAGKRWQELATSHFVNDNIYPLVPNQERSRKSHNFFFACLHEAWANLPEILQERFPDEDSLRKYALIKTGFYDVQTLVLSSKAEAMRAMEFIKPMDRFSIVLIEGSTVFRYTAQSQSLKAMGRERFMESKDKVLDWISDLIGVSRGELEARGKEKSRRKKAA